jgi:hypothetical protein
MGVCDDRETGNDPDATTPDSPVVVTASYAPNTFPCVDEVVTISMASLLSERYHFPAVIFLYPEIGSGSYAENVPSPFTISIAK